MNGDKGGWDYIKDKATSLSYTWKVHFEKSFWDGHVVGGTTTCSRSVSVAGAPFEQLPGTSALPFLIAPFSESNGCRSPLNCCFKWDTEKRYKTMIILQNWGVPHFVVVLALIFQVMGTRWWDIKPGTRSNGSGFG